MSMYNHQTELIADFDLMLGRCMRRFQQLELVIQHRVLQLGLSTSNPQDGDAEFCRLAVSELSFGAKLQLLATVLARLLPCRAEYKSLATSEKTCELLEKEISQANEAIKVIRKIEESRNRYVHSWWMALDQPSELKDLIPIVRMKLRASPKKGGDFEEFSVEALRTLLSEIEGAERQIGESCGRLLGLLKYDEDKKSKSNE